MTSRTRATAVAGGPPAGPGVARAAGDLPSGFVTFVFSDIEGSTRLLRRLGGGYEAVLERHRELLREAWQSHGGYEVDTEGDGFFVAFASTADAVDGCAAGQRLLAAEQWPDGGVVRVRMGIHCGLAAPHNGDYVALAVHQAARVIKAAHGGQILVSEQAAEGCVLRTGTELLPIGRFRLRDFDQPVKLYQVAGAGLERRFPAVRALPEEGHNLVRPANTFVGRDRELADVQAHLAPGHLVTVVGPGGVGKTRLAAEVGVRSAMGWPDGVWAVDLGQVDTADLVADAIASAVGAGAGGPSRVADLKSHLASRTALLILNSVEAHVDHCARLLPELLARCGGVCILATSREPLRVPGEVIVALDPLPAPPDSVEGAAALESPSVRLFVDRAVAARPGLEVTPAALAQIAGICRRLDGLPLAIEIAAARAPVLDLGAILAGLDDMYHLLRTSDRSLPGRQRSMQALLDWSYRLLRPGEQAALRRLSVLGAGFSLPAAIAAVAADGIDDADVPELVWSLVDRSLLVVDLAANATRYRFLETVRQYGRLLLDNEGETDAVAARLGTWYLDRLGPWRSSDRTWMGEVHVELDNLRALVLLLARADAEQAQQIACLLGLYFDAAHAFRNGIDEVARFASDLALGSSSRVSLLTILGHLHLRVGEVEPAKAALAGARELSARFGQPSWDEAGLPRAMGELAMRTGDWASAASIAELALKSDISSRGRARMWNLLGLARTAAGDLRAALAAFQEERAAKADPGQEVYLAGAEANLAEIALRLGDFDAAALHQRQCLQSALALGQPALVAYSLIMAAQLAAARGEWPTAMRLHTKAGMMLDELGQRLYDEDLAAVENVVVSARAALGEEQLAVAVQDGVALDTLSAVALAERVLTGDGAPVAARYPTSKP